VVRMVMVAAALVLAAPAMAQVDSGASAPRGRTAAGAQEGWLGMGVSCGPCSFERSGRREGGGGRWTFSTPPTVFSVDDNGPADRAGLRAGDTLLAMDGVPLTSAQGGAAFGSVRPGQTITLRYRRDGREREARLTAVARPIQNEYRALAEQARALARQQAMTAERVEEVQRQVEQAGRLIEQSREFQHAMRDLAQLQGLDSLQQGLQMDQLRRSLRMLDSASAHWQAAESVWSAIPPLPPASPLPPAAAAPAAPPAAPVAPIPPESWNREAGPLRFSGRLGDVVIEARGAGAVATTVVSDSEVVVTSHDVSVRIALRPKGAPARPSRN
jgi:PDZ domain